MKYFGKYAITLLPGKIHAQAIRQFNSIHFQPSLKKASKQSSLLSEHSINLEKNAFAIPVASYSIQSKKKKYLLKFKNSRTLSEAVSLNYEDKTAEEHHKQIPQDDNYALRREFALECSCPDTHRTKYVIKKRNNIEFEEKADSTIQSDSVTASKTKPLIKVKKSIKIKKHNTEKVNDTPSIKIDSIEDAGSKFITKSKKKYIEASDPSIIFNHKRKRNDVEDISSSISDGIPVAKKLKTEHIPSVPIKSKTFVKKHINNQKTQSKGLKVSKQAPKEYQHLKERTEKGYIERNTITPENLKMQSRFTKNYKVDKNMDFKPSIVKSKIYPKTVNMAKKINEINKIKQKFTKKSKEDGSTRNNIELCKFKTEKELTEKYKNDSKITSSGLLINDKIKKYEFLPEKKLKEQGKKFSKSSKITYAEEFGHKPYNKTEVIADDFEVVRQIESDLKNSQYFIQTGCRQAYDIVQTQRHNELEGITSVTPELSWTKQQKLSKLQQVNKETYLANVAKKLGVIDNNAEQIPKSVNKVKPKILHLNDPALSKHDFSLFQHLKQADPKHYPIVLDCAKTVAPSTKREDLTAKKKIESASPKFPVVKDALTLLKYIKAHNGRKHQVALNCSQPTLNSFGDSVTDFKDYLASKKKQTTIMDLILNKNKQFDDIFTHIDGSTKNKESNESNKQATPSASETDIENEEAQPIVNTYPVLYGLLETEPSMCGSCL